MCTGRWFYRCVPKGCKGSAGHVRCLLDHTARTPLHLKQQGAMSTWTTLLALIIGCNLHTTVQQGRVVLKKKRLIPILIDRTHVRTHHMLPPPLQGSSHTLPQSLPSPSRLLLSSDNICTPKFIKSMTSFFLPVLNNLYIQNLPARALSLPLFLVQKGDDKRRIPSAGAARPLSPPQKKRWENRREIEVTRRPLLVASSCCIGCSCRLWTPWIERERARGLAAHEPRCNDDGDARTVG